LSHSPQQSIPPSPPFPRICRSPRRAELSDPGMFKQRAEGTTFPGLEEAAGSVSAHGPSKPLGDSLVVSCIHFIHMPQLWLFLEGKAEPLATWSARRQAAISASSNFAMQQLNP